MNEQTPNLGLGLDGPVFQISKESLSPANLAASQIPLNEMTPKFLSFEPHGKGDVTYTQCDDDLGTFTLDDTATHNDPAPVTVPCPKLMFYLVGSMSDTTHVGTLAVTVHINGVPLWHETHKIDKDYDDDFSYNLHWAVPSIAPHGTYKIELSADGTNAGTKGKALCVDASMTL